MTALLYLLGALATLQTFIIGGYWREARGDTTGVVCIALLCAVWPIYVTCVTLNVLRMLKQKKRAKQGALVTKEKKGRKRDTMKNQNTEFRLLMSPLTKKVYAVRVKDMGNGMAQAVGVRHDVTVAKRAAHHEGDTQP